MNERQGDERKRYRHTSRAEDRENRAAKKQLHDTAARNVSTNSVDLRFMLEFGHRSHSGTLLSKVCLSYRRTSVRRRR